MAFGGTVLVQPGQLENFTSQESALWNAEFDALVESFLEFREFASVYQRYRQWLFQVAQRAKAELKEAFNGILAQTGFGWSVIQPEHLTRLTTDTGAANQDWLITWAAVGWADWIGSAATKNQINEDAFIAVIGLGNFDPSPKTIASHLNIEGVTNPVWDFQYAVRTGLKLWALPQPFALSPKASIHWRLKVYATGLDEPFPTGITYARSSYLQDETPNLQAP